MLEDKKYSYEMRLAKHICNVQRAFTFYKECLNARTFNLDSHSLKMLANKIKYHDYSKWEADEFDAYKAYWSVTEEKRTPKIKQDFAIAEQLHKSRNSHHPEFYRDKDMPINDIIEMFCDWMSFGFEKNDMMDIVNYYENKKSNTNPNKRFRFTKSTKDAIEKLIYAINPEDKKVFDSLIKNDINTLEYQ